MNLPTEKTKPKSSLSDAAMLVYGKPKIGKSSLASQFPHALFLATEPGLNALEVYQVPIRTWEDFLSSCAEIAKGEHKYQTIVVDTIDNLYRFCADHVCKKLNIAHESDASHGKAYGIIKNELCRVLSKLASLPYGLILISHSQDKQMQTRTGEVTRTVPTLSESFRQIVIGMVDLILYCDVDVEKGADGKSRQVRVVRTKPNVNYDAGDRYGYLPEVIDLSYSAIEKAFAETGNKQTDGKEKES